jgi:hypothetical protein
MADPTIDELVEIAEREEREAAAEARWYAAVAVEALRKLQSVVHRAYRETRDEDAAAFEALIGQLGNLANG